MKSEIVTALGSGETVAESWVPPGIEGYFQDSALQPVISSSVPLGLRVRAGFDSNSRNSMIMEKVQADWKRSSDGRSSVEVELFNQDWKTYLRELKLNPPDVFRFGWLAAFADPISHLQALTSSNPNNLTGWHHARYDRLVSEIESLRPGPEREKKVIEAQKLLVGQECVVIPIYHYVQVHAVSPRVKNFNVNGLGIVRWSDLVLK